MAVGSPTMNTPYPFSSRQHSSMPSQKKPSACADHSFMDWTNLLSSEFVYAPSNFHASFNCAFGQWETCVGISRCCWHIMFKYLRRSTCTADMATHLRDPLAETDDGSHKGVLLLLRRLSSNPCNERSGTDTLSSTFSSLLWVIRLSLLRLSSSVAVARSLSTTRHAGCL
jgi:hypothetical protein